MVTAGVSPRMMAQKAQVAGISREPTAVPGPVPSIPNGPALRPRAGSCAPARSVLRRELEPDAGASRLAEESPALGDLVDELKADCSGESFGRYRSVTGSAW